MPVYPGAQTLPSPRDTNQLALLGHGRDKRTVRPEDGFELLPFAGLPRLPSQRRKRWQSRPQEVSKKTWFGDSRLLDGRFKERFQTEWVNRGNVPATITVRS